MTDREKAIELLGRAKSNANYWGEIYIDEAIAKLRLNQPQKKRMVEHEYQIEKHTTVEWIVTVSTEGGILREPVAKCNSQGAALTLKGMYEQYDKELEDKELEDKELEDKELENQKLQV